MIHDPHFFWGVLVGALAVILFFKGRQFFNAIPM
jgi:hypothetical protein